MFLIKPKPYFSSGFQSGGVSEKSGTPPLRNPNKMKAGNYKISFLSFKKKRDCSARAIEDCIFVQFL